MRALLDTHTFLWAVHSPEKISAPARSALLLQQNVLYLSQVSLWEIVIKYSNRRLALPAPPTQFVLEHARLNRFTLLAISPKHFQQLERLPLHHRDPFDRMLAAQALAEGLPLVSADAQLARYGVEVIW